jgi:pimeloyl-ACP methyl ester carboxylesterase
MTDHDLTVDTPHATIAVRDTAGGGTPVLLLPGAGANLAWMAGLTDALRDRHRVISVDLPGHGGSLAPVRKSRDVEAVRSSAITPAWTPRTGSPCRSGPTRGSARRTSRR